MKDANWVCIIRSNTLDTTGNILMGPVIIFVRLVVILMYRCAVGELKVFRENTILYGGLLHFDSVHQESLFGGGVRFRPLSFCIKAV